MVSKIGWAPLGVKKNYRSLSPGVMRGAMFGEQIRPDLKKPDSQGLSYPRRARPGCVFRSIVTGDFGGT